MFGRLCLQLWLPFHPQHDIMYIDPDFRSNEVEKSEIKCEALIEQRIDHIFAACTFCGNQKLYLDTPTTYIPARAECFGIKQPDVKGHTSVLKPIISC